MNSILHRSVVRGVAVLLLGLALCQPLMAMRGLSASQVQQGAILNIDYLHHSITIGGQVLQVAPNAKYQGVADFSILHVGMRIQYVLDFPDNAAPVIVAITALPS